MTSSSLKNLVNVFFGMFSLGKSLWRAVRNQNSSRCSGNSRRCRRIGTQAYTPTPTLAPISHRPPPPHTPPFYSIRNFSVIKMPKLIHRSRPCAVKKRPLSRISCDGGEEPVYDNRSSSTSSTSSSSATSSNPACSMAASAATTTAQPSPPSPRRLIQRRKSSNGADFAQDLYENQAGSQSQSYCRLSGRYGKANPRRATTAAEEALYATPPHHHHHHQKNPL